MQNLEWYLADLKSTEKNTIETVDKSLTDMFIRLVRIYPCLYNILSRDDGRWPTIGRLGNIFCDYCGRRICQQPSHLTIMKLSVSQHKDDFPHSLKFSWNHFLEGCLTRTEKLEPRPRKSENGTKMRSWHTVQSVHPVTTLSEGQHQCVSLPGLQFIAIQHEIYQHPNAHHNICQKSYTKIKVLFHIIYGIK